MLGSDKVNVILNCYFVMGCIGKVGMGLFLVIGQLNVMGGCEVGGLVNMLVCYLDIENLEYCDVVQEFWKLFYILVKQGLKVVDMFDVVVDGKIKVFWIIYMNLVVMMFKVDKVCDVIVNCDFVVVLDIIDQIDIVCLVDVVLFVVVWVEKSGIVINFDCMISCQCKIFDVFGQSWVDWDILFEVGCWMGWKDGFDYDYLFEIFVEYVKMLVILGEFGKDFDISLLGGVDVVVYDVLVFQ